MSLIETMNPLWEGREQLSMKVCVSLHVYVCVSVCMSVCATQSGLCEKALGAEGICLDSGIF